MDVTVSHLTKKFGSTTVLDDLSFGIRAGEVIGFLGPNGAGKTTTMRVLTGYLAPTSGSVTIGGMDSLQDGERIRRLIGYLPENNPLYAELKVYEYLEFAAAAKGVAQRSAEIRRVVAACGLTGRPTQLIGTLSKGFKQRVGLAAALLGNPSLIILDEPTSGLDPNQVLEIRALIREVGRSKTVILSTHVLSEVEATCTGALIIHRGRIVASGTTAQIVASVQGRSQLRAVVDGPAEAVAAALGQIAGVRGVNGPSGSEPTYWLETEPHADARRAVFMLCAQRQWPLLELERKTVTLEDVFHQLTT